MAYLKVALKEKFQEYPKIISKTKNFISELQFLESRIDKINIPKAEDPINALKESIMLIKEYLAKILGGKYNLFPMHWTYLKKNICNSSGIAQKKIIIKNEIQYLKNYINTKGGMYWDETNHTDIIYIYWHSKTDLKMIKKMASCLKFLEREVSRLENQSAKKDKSSLSRQECYGNI